jgi:predicted ATP-grasp superfamily ATP-dependent carboligase
MKHQVPPFQVLLIAGIDAIGLARFPYLLHNAGCRVTLLAPAGLAIIRSRYVSNHLLTSYDPQQRALDLKELLSSQEQSFDWVIVGDETSLTALAAYRGQDWLDGWFPVDHRTAAVDVMLSKREFYQAAIQAGIRMPFSTICHSRAEVEAAVQLAGYPVMLKTGAGMSGSGVFKVHDAAELVAAYTTLAAIDHKMLVQRFYYGQIGSTDVLFNHGQPVCWQSSYSLKCWPTPLASSSARQLMQHPDVEDILLKTGQITGFHGFAGVDWIHDPVSDHLYVLELNPRPTPSYHLDRFSGVSFSRSLKQLLSGNSLVSRPVVVKPFTKLIRLFPQNLYWAVSGRDFRSFMFCWQDAPWHDFLLLLAYLRRVLTHYLPKVWLQKAKRWVSNSAL